MLGRQSWLPWQTAIIKHLSDVCPLLIVACIVRKTDNLTFTLVNVTSLKLPHLNSHILTLTNLIQTRDPSGVRVKSLYLHRSEYWRKNSENMSFGRKVALLLMSL